MLRQINENIGIIIEEAKDETTTSQKYKQVKPVYKVGCRGCDTLVFTPYLCPACLQHSETVDTTQLTEIIKKIEDAQINWGLMFISDY